MVVKSTPCLASRFIVQVVVRDVRSTWPEETATIFCLEARGTNFILLPSPSTAAATARAISTSNPTQRPEESGMEKPGTPSLIPQVKNPLALTSSSVPAKAWVPTIARPRTRTMIIPFSFIMLPPLFWLDKKMYKTDRLLKRFQAYCH